MVKKLLALSFAAMITIFTPPPYRLNKRRQNNTGKCFVQEIFM